MNFSKYILIFPLNLTWTLWPGTTEGRKSNIWVVSYNQRWGAMGLWKIRPQYGSGKWICYISPKAVLSDAIKMCNQWMILSSIVSRHQLSFRSLFRTQGIKEHIRMKRRLQRTSQHAPALFTTTGRRSTKRCITGEEGDAVLLTSRDTTVVGFCMALGTSYWATVMTFKVGVPSWTDYLRNTNYSQLPEWLLEMMKETEAPLVLLKYSDRHT